MHGLRENVYWVKPTQIDSTWVDCQQNENSSLGVGAVQRFLEISNRLEMSGRRRCQSIICYRLSVRICCLFKSCLIHITDTGAQLSIGIVWGYQDLLPIKSCLVHISDTDAHVSQAVRNCCLFKAALSMSRILVPVSVSNCFGVRENVYLTPFESKGINFPVLISELFPCISSA